MDVVVKQEIVGVPQIFWVGFFGNEVDFLMNDIFDMFVEQAICFFNLETSYQLLFSLVGIWLGDCLFGCFVYVDIFDELVWKGICTNWNKFIFGLSGSGKFFFINYMVCSYYEQGMYIVFVDVGYFYKGLCDLVNGYYFIYDEFNLICFNFFYISKGDLFDIEKKESIKILLFVLWKKDDERFNWLEYVVLFIVLQTYYKFFEMYYSIFLCFDIFYEFLCDVFVCIFKEDKVKEKDFDVENFLYVL